MTSDDRPEPINLADLLKREGMAPTRGRRRSGRRHAPPETPDPPATLDPSSDPSAARSADEPAERPPTEGADRPQLPDPGRAEVAAAPPPPPVPAADRPPPAPAGVVEPPAVAPQVASRRESEEPVEARPSTDEPLARAYPPPVPEQRVPEPEQSIPTQVPTAAAASEAPSTEDEAPARGDEAPARGKASWRQRHPALLAAIVLGVVVVLGVAYYATVLLVAQDRITRETVLRVDGPEILEPQLQTDTQTFLIVVSDGAAKSGSAEVTALAHLSADESRLVIVSFPRETLVDVPACGSASRPVPAFTGTLAATYARGGGRCSVAAVQALTGIRINHYLGVDLARFPKMIDSLGGVAVCLTAPLRDPDNGVSLPAGQTELTGAQATDYVRAVAGGGGADPARASRQISFLSTVFSEALGASTLANPIRVTKFAFAVADVLTLDPDTSLGDLRDLGSHLRDLSAGREARKVSIVVPPVTPSGSGDTAAPYESLDPDQSRAMFDAIIVGQPIPDISSQPPANSAPPADPSASGPPSSPSTPAATSAPVVTDC